MFHVQETFVNNWHMVATGTATKVSRSNSEPSDHPNFIEKQWSCGVVGVSNFLGEIPQKWFDDEFGAENLHQNLTPIVLVRAPVNKFEKVPIDSP